jgi:hypothetical protein
MSGAIPKKMTLHDPSDQVTMDINSLNAAFGIFFQF